MSGRVAVVIACFNDGPLLPEALESVREAEPLEVVVVNDGSTEPETLAVLREIADNGVNVIDRPNGGLSAARMTGVGETAAPYVFPLDADDRLAEGALSDLADALDQSTSAAFAFGDYEVFGDYEGLWRSPRRFDLWAQTWANLIPVGSLVRRQALLEVGGWEGRHVEDWDLWLKLGEAGWTGRRVERVVYFRRIHGERMHARVRRRYHRQLVDGLRRRHPDLFGSRARLAREYGVSFPRRVAYPLLFGLRNRNLLPYALEARMLRWHLKRQLKLAGRQSPPMDAQPAEPPP